MLILDAAFSFFLNPSSPAWEAVLPPSPIEIDALSRLSRAAIVRFRESLEPGLRRHRPTEAAALRDPAARRHREPEP